MDEDGEEKKDEKEDTEKVNSENTKEKKQLIILASIIGFMVVAFLVAFIFISSAKHFTYNGIDFEIVKEGNLILYRTSLPVNSNKVVTTGKDIAANYNFYLRNDPRSLRNIPFEVDELVMRKNVFFNFTEEFNCGGYGVIGVANLVNLMNAIGVSPGKNETAKCEESGAYTFIQLQAGNETSIEQTGKSCYNLNINNCEALEVTEKLMVEMFSRLNEAL